MTTLYIMLICLGIFLGLKVFTFTVEFIAKNATILAIILIGIILYAVM